MMRKKTTLLMSACAAALAAAPALADTVTFQQGTSGYSSTRDTYLRKGSLSGYNFGGQDVIYVLSSGNENPSGQGILEFGNLFGSNPGQVPATGQVITSATLTLNVEGMTIGGYDPDASRFIKAFPMLQPVPNYGTENGAAATIQGDSYEVSYDARGWSSATSWMRWGGGETNLGVGPIPDYDYDTNRQVTKIFTVPAQNTAVPIDVTNIVSSWYTGTLANNGFFLRPDDNGFTGVYLTSSEGSTVAFRPQLSISYITSDPNTGTWKVDGAGDWTQASNWFGVTPTADTYVAKFGSAITSQHTVYSDSDTTVGGLIFDNANMYVLAGAGNLTLSNSSGSATVSVLQGTHKINLPLTVASNVTLDLASGTTLKISDPVTINADKTLTKTGSGSVVYESTITLQSGAAIAFDSSQHVPALTVGPNATATVLADGASVLEIDTLPSVSSAGGKIDLKNNKMVLRGQDAGSWSGSQYGGVSGLIAEGKLTTSMPDASSLLTSLGVRTVGGDTTVAYTYTGDADLDGNIDGDDFSAIDAGYSAQNSNPLGVSYAGGDFNYSGAVDADDYWLIDRNYAKQTTPFASAPAVGGVGAVPEPSTAALLTIGGAALIQRRRRR
jgi:hypothetical protein